MAAVRQYVKDDGKKYVEGINPKRPERKSIFSAAPIYEHNQLTGYVYAILAREKQEEEVAALNEPFFNSLRTAIFFPTLFVAFLSRMITFSRLTDSTCKIAS